MKSRRQQRGPAPSSRSTQRRDSRANHSHRIFLVVVGQARDEPPQETRTLLSTRSTWDANGNSRSSRCDSLTCVITPPGVRGSSSMRSSAIFDQPRAIVCGRPEECAPCSWTGVALLDESLHLCNVLRCQTRVVSRDDRQAIGAEFCEPSGRGGVQSQVVVAPDDAGM